MTTSTASSLPPKASDGVFAVSASTVIDAEIEKVWSVLIDFPSYHEWNPFVRDQKIVSRSKKPTDDQTPAEGKYLHIKRVNMPATMDDSSVWIRGSAFELITAVDHEHHRLSWISMMTSYKFLFHADRWQSLSVLEGGKTKYETIEVFGGLLAWFMKFLVQGNLNDGFKAMGEGLKKRSEEL